MSEKFLIHEKLTPLNLSTLLMGWNKMKYNDVKHFTLVSITLEEEEFYEDASGNEVANLL